LITALLPVASSGSMSTISPTATGFVEVISSILKIPLMRALKITPLSVLAMYQLPVDL
jgi:hypothetical protein